MASVCHHFPTTPPHHIDTYSPLKGAVRYPSQVEFCPQHTSEHSLLPINTPETWLRTLAPHLGRRHCQGAPEMASEAGTLPPFTAGSVGSLFQKILSLSTLQTYISQAPEPLSPWATNCLAI